MRMLTHYPRVLTILVALCCQWLATAAHAEDPLPCPDDCIAAFELLWSGDESHEVVQTAIGDITREMGRRSPEDIASIGVQESRYLFVAFKRHCDEKEAALRPLLEETFAFLQPGVEFRVMDGPFVRGRDTMRFRGDFWDEDACCTD